MPANRVGSSALYMARFEREAQLLAALNHSNIAAMYGIEQGALVMELVEGADLKGPLPLAEAIAIAREIAAGLEAAHEKGIIHRDLKPANIKLTPAGVVKIPDFGLAKSAEPGAESATSATMSPTLSLEMTRAARSTAPPPTYRRNRRAASQWTSGRIRSSPANDSSKASISRRPWRR